ncbi:MAG: hypothetical protein ACRDKL_03670 [Solirubrobacteraceae bacterium]
MVVAIVSGGVPSGVQTLLKAVRSPVSATAGVDYCFGEDWPDNRNGAGVKRLVFLRWLKARMGPDAVYTLDYRPPPDTGCVGLALLPALPAGPGERAEWTIAWGAVPAEMRARIAAHDPSVRVFGPGLALQWNGRR